MIEIIFLLSLALIWIIFATIQDIKKREVANWLNFSLIIFALGFRFFFCLFSENFSFFYQGIIGLLIFFVMGNIFYYSKLFAGGDAKLLIALGAILPLSTNFIINLYYFFYFIFIFLIIGGIYGFIFSIVLAIKNKKQFKKQFKIEFKQNKKIIYLSIFSAILFSLFGFYFSLFFYLSILILALPYLFIYSKSVEKSSMIKEISTKKLTEGDWLYKDIKIKNKTIKATWEGLSKKEIKLIKNNLKKVKIKQGIPFVPVFLISFLIFIYFFFRI